MPTFFSNTQNTSESPLFGVAVSSSSDFTFVSSMDAKRCPFSSSLHLWQQENVAKVVSGEYGG
ncbi:hypothetical protein WN55_10014 [Dufourea novaeangliae]|uniref:Uncharacterized protein n=1 Tax=Dufourea novaeangliae TaxID=178035 RepID=A0A154P8G3_DUFNO|nr:hypothetical protein WN55_10014 [Dufourea novaeangliae]